MNDRQSVILETAQMHAYFNLVFKLLERGALSQEDAASIMVDNANDVRTATEREGEVLSKHGERIAGTYETFAAALLGVSKLP